MIITKKEYEDLNSCKNKLEESKGEVRKLEDENYATNINMTKIKN